MYNNKEDCRINLYTFPSSGHDMLSRLLDDFYKFNKMNYTYCEYYTCCKKIPCVKGSMYQKSHDFDLINEIKQNEKYIVLFRKNKIENLESYYRYIIKNNDNIDSLLDYSKEESYSLLLQFCKNYSFYYDGFVKKYTNLKMKNVLCIDYNDFVNNPLNTFYNITKFLNFDNSLNEIEFFFKNREEKIYKRNKMCKIIKDRLEMDLS